MRYPEDTDKIVSDGSSRPTNSISDLGTQTSRHEWKGLVLAQ